MGPNDKVTRFPKHPSCTIANGGTNSTGIDFSAYAFGQFTIPSAFTGATVTFQCSVDGSTYTTLNDSSNATISYTVTASRTYPLPDELSGAHYFRIVSASAEGAARTILLSLKG